MRAFIWTIILFSLAIGLAISARFNLGNVVFFYPPYRIDLSLNLFIFILLLVFGMFYTLLQALVLTRNLPKKVAQYRIKKCEQETGLAFRSALRYFLEGRFGHAEKAAQKAQDLPQYAGLASLIGARAAHYMGENNRSTQWLENIRADKDLSTALKMTQAELALENHDPQSALTYLGQLNAAGIRHIHALRLALKANQQTKKWDEVLRILKILDKNNALNATVSLRLREATYNNQLLSKSKYPDELRKIWTNIPDEDKLDARIASKAAHAFCNIGLYKLAREIIEQALTAQWDTQLLRAYQLAAAEAGSHELLAQIEHCESWLADKPNDADLLQCLGVLCTKQKLWGKAQVHFERALLNASENASRKDTYLKLAQLYDALQNKEQAAEYYRHYALCS